MGFLDDLKGRADELGDRLGDLGGKAKDKAGDLAGDVKDRAADLVEDVRDRLDGDQPDAYDEVLKQAAEKRATPPTDAPSV